MERSLKESDVRKAVKQAKSQGVEVPSSASYSYVNPVHEEQAAEIIKADYPNVVVSSRILRRWIETRPGKHGNLCSLREAFAYTLHGEPERTVKRSQVQRDAALQHGAR